MEVGPPDSAVAFARHNSGQAFAIKVFEGFLDPCLGITELDRGQGAAIIAVGTSAVTGMADRPQQRIGRAVRGPDGVVEIRRAYQAVATDARFVREMVEHQDALTSAVRADLETGPVSREPVSPRRPWPGRGWTRRIDRMIAIVEYRLEQPFVIGFRPAALSAQFRQVRLPVSIADRLGITLCSS